MSTFIESPSAFAFLANVAQGFDRLSNHQDVSDDWFPSETYRVTFQALQEIENAGETPTKELSLAWLDQTNRKVDKYQVAELFDEPVSGTATGYHKGILKANWLASKKQAVHARIEDATRRKSFDELPALLAEIQAIDAAGELSVNGRGNCNQVGLP